MGFLVRTGLKRAGGGGGLNERRVLIEDLQYMLLIVFFFVICILNLSWQYLKYCEKQTKQIKTNKL